MPIDTFTSVLLLVGAIVAVLLPAFSVTEAVRQYRAVTRLRHRLSDDAVFRSLVPEPSSKKQLNEEQLAKLEVRIEVVAKELGKDQERALAGVKQSSSTGRRNFIESLAGI